MNLRLCASICGAALGTALLVAPLGGEENWTGPRTPNGHPDLQGYWTNATYTPLERAPELGTKEFFTPAEAAEFERQRRLREANQPANDIHYDDALWQTENYAKGVSNLRTSLIFDPPDGRVPALTEKGKQRAVQVAEAARRRAAADSAPSRSLAERCISWGSEGPPMMPSTYNSNLQIVQTASSVIVYNEMVHNVRVIPVDGRPHLPPSVRQLGGDSRGHWEGDTLVVESTNFTDETNFRGPPSTTRQDIFSSRDLRVIERFTRVAPDTILYRFTVEDPSTWVRPWSGEMVMRRFEGPLYEYACHEGNYGLENILAGARAAEKAAAGSQR
jgi:hypothetical protein